MNRLSATLDASDMQTTMVEIGSLPAQPNNLNRPQTMPEGGQYHGGVPMTVPIAAGRDCRLAAEDLLKDVIERMLRAWTN